MFAAPGHALCDMLVASQLTFPGCSFMCCAFALSRQRRRWRGRRRRPQVLGFGILNPNVGFKLIFEIVALSRRRRALARKKAAAAAKKGASSAAAAAAAREAKERAKKGKKKDTSHFNQARPRHRLR